MRALAPIALFSLAACATTADIYASPVDEAEVVNRPLAEVSSCLQLRTGKPPITTPDGKTTFIDQNQSGMTVSTISLSPQDGGTLVEVRRASSLAVTSWWHRCR